MRYERGNGRKTGSNTRPDTITLIGFRKAINQNDTAPTKPVTAEKRGVSCPFRMTRALAVVCVFFSIACGGSSAPTGSTSPSLPTTTSSACAGDPECQTLSTVQPTRAYLLHVPGNF